MSIEQFTKWCSTEIAVATSEFAIGFTSIILSRDAFEFPLSAMVPAFLSGYICRYGALCVDKWLCPKEFRFLFPLMASASCFYYVQKSFKR